MSEELGFKLSVDPGNSQKTVADFKNEIAAAKEQLSKISEEFGASSEQAKAAKAEVDKLNNALKETPVKSFKQELKEAKENALNMARTFGELSPQAVAASNAFQKLKEEMADMNELSAATFDEKRFETFANFGASIAGGFSAAEGAITLATGGSKEFEQAMLKVQAAMALSQGLSQISDVGRQWGLAKAALGSFTVVQKSNTAATAAAGVIQKLFSGSVDMTSTSFKVLKGAIIATGIGALVAVVGYLINNFSSLKETLFKLLPFLETIGKFIGKIVEATTDFVGVTSAATREADKLRTAITDQNDAHGKQIELLEASGASAKTIRELKGKMYDEEIAKLNKISSLKGKASDEDAKQIKELQFQKELLKAQQAKDDADAAKEAQKKAEEAHKKAVEDAKKHNSELAKIHKQQLADQQKLTDDIHKLMEDAREKANAALKDKHAFELQLLEAQGKSVLGVREKQIDEEIELLNELGGGKQKDAIIALEREKVLVAAKAKTEAEKDAKEKAEKDKEAADKKAKEQDDLKKELEAANAEELAKKAEEKKFADEELNAAAEAAEMEQLKTKYDAMLAVVKGNEELTTAVIEAESEAQSIVRKKWDDISLNQKKENAAKLASVLGGISNVIGKETGVGKGLAVAESTINTYLAASKALTGIAKGNPFSAALAIAQAAVVVGSGLKSVREIVKTKVPTTSGGDSSGGSATSSSTSSPAVSTAPTMDGIQSTLVQQTKELTEGKDALKAYVVESEITQKQERQKAITQTANF